MNRIALLFLFVHVGCSGDSTPPIPSATRDFVTNSNGIGTAQLFGIDFRVNVTSSGATSTSSINANLVEADQSSARKRITFGDSIAIQLDSVDESMVSFSLNDRDYGKLNVGDFVEIDEDGKVKVNGVPRSPSSAE
ncbi:MAG: hypothetical protein KDB23_25840 [Planctomycetales bacterium]|nr:hypothetical protein [Planctomycetales bacterium]